MGFSDFLWMGLIMAGALYLLYRSIWMKKGHCCGCTSTTCQEKKKYGPRVH
jgi:hypothetical protein